MIKQIQLRGISRTPSDRMSEDGGLSESLNMYLDTAENAPVLVPKDVTEERGLPADLLTERIFIHKTANYENYIVVQRGKVVAYTSTKDAVNPLPVLELTNEEEINDITSVGNTIIVATTKSMYYLLYKNREYIFLGNGIPFPLVEFETKNILSKSLNLSVSFDDHNYVPEELDQLWFNNFDPNSEDSFLPPSEDDWNYDSRDSKEHENSLIRRCLDALWGEFDTTKKKMLEDNALHSPIFIRYVVDVLGEKVSSMPILLTPEYTPFKAALAIYNTHSFDKQSGQSWTSLQEMETSNLTYYNIHAKLKPGFNIENWADIISSIRIYISSPIGLNKMRYSTIMSNRVDNVYYEPGTDNDYVNTRTSFADINFRPVPDYENNLLLSSSLVYCVKEIKIFDNVSKQTTQDFKELQGGFILDIKKYLDSSQNDYVVLESQEFLSGDDMKHYHIMGNRLDHYNNAVALTSVSQAIDYGYSDLNSIFTKEVIRNNKSTIFDITYLLNCNSGDKVVKKTFDYSDREKIRKTVYAFQTFPDSRCYKMLVKITDTTSTGSEVMTTIKYGEFDMSPHPYLDCAYYYGGIDKELINLCTSSTPSKNYDVNNIDDTDNKLVFSQIDNPFIYPIDRRYTFQSKVIGIAVATTALSQGQFGQFPLYVFTEDGIWAMETASDGSFVSQKPLSREVCVNPDSICSIDNAVVFVTAKGVMMIQGSQVINISPYMNGRHYIPNESAVNLIKNQEGFEQLESAIVDEEPFMTFMKKTKVTYDYVGQRLIFIAEDEAYQYIYKIDTQTWHKTAFSSRDLWSPMNSYPECLGMGRINGDKTQILNLLKIDNWESFESAIQNQTPITIREYHGDFLDKQLYDLGVVISTQHKGNFVRLVLQDIVRTDKEATQEDQDILAEYMEAPRYLEMLLLGKRKTEVFFLPLSEKEDFIRILDKLFLGMRKEEQWYEHKFLIKGLSTRVFDLSTPLDVSTDQSTARGILITRPFDLGEPDVYKSIKSIKIRGDFDKGNVKYILQGSDNGRDFYTLTSLRGKSWKMFRIFILADLEPTERISWIDVDYEPRYQNKLR